MKTREWMKASPFGNAQAREKILQEAMDKVKAGRSRNIQKLRTGEQNLSELAREILNDTMSVTVPHKASPDSVAALSLPVVRASVADDAINVVFDARADVDAVATDVEVMEDGASRSSVDGNNSSSRSSSNSSSSSSSSGSSSSGNVGGVGVGPPAYCWDEDEAELIRFLGTDEHQLLMEEIAEAMKAEYGDYEADQLFGDDVGASAAVDWSQAEEEATGRYVICPVCRSASMEIDGPAGKCSCGALVNLRHGAGGDVLSVDQFRDLLAAVFDRHTLVCCDSAPFTDDTCDLKTAGLYGGGDTDGTYETCSTAMAVEGASAPGSNSRGGLEFIPRDDGSLVAFCSFCGFAERVV